MHKVLVWLGTFVPTKPESQLPIRYVSYLSWNENMQLHWFFVDKTEDSWWTMCRRRELAIHVLYMVIVIAL